MHKIFAKPLFFGKKVYFLPQCHSTNDELLSLARQSNEPEGTVLYTNDQTRGKGQRGNIWLAEPGKNILMSILLRPKQISPSDQYYLNLIAGLALVDSLKEYNVQQLSLKWPNDIYIGEKKAGGVLIENNLRSNRLEYAVLGIGLNVNQQAFSLKKATSLFLEINREINCDNLIDSILFYIENWYLKLKAGDLQNILSSYQSLLFWRGELHRYKSEEGEFDGEIVGINNSGDLAVNCSGELKTFKIKEIEFLY